MSGCAATTMRWTRKKITQPTVDELCATHRNEEAHARQVAALALHLFDAVRVPFNLHRRDRLLLETAARLHDIGYADHPEKHVSAGVELVRESGLHGFTDAQVNDIAAIMALHGHITGTHLPDELMERSTRPHRVFQLGAILRIADALDHSHMQDSKILRVVTANGMIRLHISAPRNSGNPERVMAKSDLWQRVFALGLVIEPVQRGIAGRPRATMSAQTAIRHLLLAQYNILRTAIRRAARSEDEEALHDLRIAVRSMRRLIEAFARPLRKTSAAADGEQLREFAKQLGPVRDLDVWVSILTRPRYAEFLVDAETFVAEQRKAQEEEHARLKEKLNAPELKTLLLHLGLLLRIEMTQPSQRATRPFGPIARREVRSAWKALMEKREWALSRKPSTLHALRIRIRKLRTLASLVAPVLGADHKRFIFELRELERNLGRIHDIDEALTRAVDANAPPAFISALAKRRRREARQFRAAWIAFDQPTLHAQRKALFSKK